MTLRGFKGRQPLENPRLGSLGHENPGLGSPGHENPCRGSPGLKIPATRVAGSPGVKIADSGELGFLCEPPAY